jgi:hypothetical protein
MRALAIAAASVLLASSGAAVAQTGDLKDPDRIKCKYQAGENSRISKKVCKTNRDWVRDKERFRNALEKKQRDSLMNTPQGG